MAVEKLTERPERRRHRSNSITTTPTTRWRSRRRRTTRRSAITSPSNALNGAKYVEGMGYEIATLPVALCELYGSQRGLPQNWYYRAEYNDEMRKLIALASDFNPHGKSM
jgi:hypothetical protein